MTYVPELFTELEALVAAMSTPQRDRSRLPDLIRQLKKPKPAPDFIGRTAHHLYSQEDLDTLVERLTDDAPGEARGHIHSAIGYLSTWASDAPRYAVCSLHINGSDEIIATYRDAEGKLTYQIGAVWNGTNFGFHS